MEQLNTPPLDTPPPQPPPGPAPLPPPPPPPMPPAQPGQQYAKGGIAGFFEGVTFTDVAMIALGSLAFGLVIYYFRKKILFMKNEKAQHAKEIEDLKTQQQALANAVYGQQSQKDSGPLNSF